MSQYRIVAEHTERGPAVSALEEALYQHNRTATGCTEWHPMLFCVRDEAGEFCGGIAGYLWAGWLHATLLWLREELRGVGLGSQLLRAAEDFAVEHGCFDVHLSTFDFQAPELYRKHGYAVFGQLAEYPKGHTQLFLHKRIDLGPKISG